MLDRFRRAVAVMRPRAIAHMAARIDKLDVGARELRAEVQKQMEQMHHGLRHSTQEAFERLHDDIDNLRQRTRRGQELLRQQSTHHEAVTRQLGDIAASVDAVATTLTSLQAALQAVQLKTEQLAEIARIDTADDGRLDTLPAILQTDRVRAHVSKAIATSELHDDPFPHVVVDQLFPPDMYAALVAGIPPRALFEDRPVNKQQLKVPPTFAPVYSRRVWRFLTDEIVKHDLSTAVVNRLREPLTEYLHRFWPSLTLDDPALSLAASDGRIMLRRAGYVIPPHRDPRWGFITVLLFLARQGDPETWGTQFYRVREDLDATSALPHWIDAGRCELVKEIAFRPNRALVFMNSEGAHAASIPADAPPEFERYTCQWRVGPDAVVMRRLMAELSPQARAAWEGKERYS